MEREGAYVTRTVVLIGVLSRRGDFQPKSVWWGPCLQQSITRTRCWLVDLIQNLRLRTSCSRQPRRRPSPLSAYGSRANNNRRKEKKFRIHVLASSLSRSQSGLPDPSIARFTAPSHVTQHVIDAPRFCLAPKHTRPVLERMPRSPNEKLSPAAPARHAAARRYSAQHP
jgi:hypothetical protein